jgi:hypothetical protein
LITDGKGAAQASFDELEDEIFADESDDLELDALERELNASVEEVQELVFSTERAEFVEDADDDSEVDRTLDLLEVELKKSATEGLAILEKNNQEREMNRVGELADAPSPVDLD